MRSNSYPIIGYIGNSFEHQTFNKRGNLYNSRVTDEDIFLVEKVTYVDRYLRIFKYSNNQITCGIYTNVDGLTLGSDALLNTLKLRIFSNGNVEILETIKNND